jgi:hypothetical protein
MSVEKFSFNSSPTANSSSPENLKSLTEKLNKLERLSNSDLKKLCDIVSKSAISYKANQV